MRQQINLVNSIPKYKIKPLQTKQIFIICGLFFLALIAYNIVDIWKNSRLRTSYNILSTKTMLLDLQLKKLKEDNPSLADENYTDKAILKIKGNLKAKQEIVQILKGSKGSTNINGYSNYFLALANTIPDNAWLNRIQIRKGTQDIILSGKAYSSQDAINYVATLNTTKEFKDRRFELAQVSQPSEESKIVSFVITSKATKE